MCVNSKHYCAANNLEIEAEVFGYLLDLSIEPEVGGVDGGQPGVTAGHGHEGHDGHQEEQGAHDDMVTGVDTGEDEESL